MRKVPGRGESRGRWETEMRMEGKSRGVDSEDASAVEVLVMSLVSEELIGQEQAPGLSRCL